MQAQGRTDEAIEHYRQVTRIAPTEHLAHYNLGAALLRVGQTAEALTEFVGIPDARRALEHVAPSLGGWCCVTAGPDGVYAIEAGKLNRYPAFRVNVVDTLGAGDVWHGAFALALAEGSGEAGAVRFASAAAALKVQRPGGRSGAPLRAELDAFLDEFGG